MTPLHSQLSDAITHRDALDRVAAPVQHAVHDALEHVPRVARLLHGQRWLGHPLHAAVTDVPVGAFTAALVFDLLGGRRPARDLRRAADLATKVGLASALFAALPGLADWSGTRRDARRLGLVHGVLNLGIAGLYGASLLDRARGRRGRARAFSAAAYALLLGSSWLGGELSYAQGVGVHRQRRRLGREERRQRRIDETRVAPI